MNHRLSAVLAAGLVIVFGTGLLFVSSALGQQAPAPQRPPRGQAQEQECASVLPRQAIEAILANHRERLRTAREAMATQERALRNLLIADTSTLAALDAQIARSNEARNAFARASLDALWDLRSVIPAEDRQVAFRCAERMLMRGNR